MRRGQVEYFCDIGKVGGKERQGRTNRDDALYNLVARLGGISVSVVIVRTQDRRLCRHDSHHGMTSTVIRRKHPLERSKNVSTPLICECKTWLFASLYATVANNMHYCQKEAKSKGCRLTCGSPETNYWFLSRLQYFLNLWIPFICIVKIYKKKIIHTADVWMKDWFLQWYLISFMPHGMYAYMHVRSML